MLRTPQALIWGTSRGWHARPALVKSSGMPVVAVDSAVDLMERPSPRLLFARAPALTTSYYSLGSFATEHQRTKLRTKRRCLPHGRSHPAIFQISFVFSPPCPLCDPTPSRLFTPAEHNPSMPGLRWMSPHRHLTEDSLGCRETPPPPPHRRRGSTTTAIAQCRNRGWMLYIPGVSNGRSFWRR